MQQQLTQPSWAWILETAAEAFHPRDSSESDLSRSMSCKPGSDLQGYLDKQTKNRSVSSLTLHVQYPTSQVLISRDTWTNKKQKCFIFDPSHSMSSKPGSDLQGYLNKQKTGPFHPWDSPGPSHSMICKPGSDLQGYLNKQTQKHFIFDPSRSMACKPGSDLQGYLNKQTKKQKHFIPGTLLTLHIQWFASQVLISRDTWTNKQKTEAFHLWPFTFNVLQARFWSPGIPEQTKNRSVSSLGLPWPCTFNDLQARFWSPGILEQTNKKQKHFIFDPSHSISYKPGSDLQGYLNKQTKNRSVSSLTLHVQCPASQVLLSRNTWTNKQKCFIPGLHWP